MAWSKEPSQHLPPVTDFGKPPSNNRHQDARGGNRAWILPDAMNLERYRNEGEGETRDRRDNPPTNGIVRHDSHLRKYGGFPSFSTLVLRQFPGHAESESCSRVPLRQPSTMVFLYPVARHMLHAVKRWYSLISASIRPALCAVTFAAHRSLRDLSHTLPSNFFLSSFCPKTLKSVKSSSEPSRTHQDASGCVKVLQKGPVTINPPPPFFSNWGKRPAMSNSKQRADIGRHEARRAAFPTPASFERRSRMGCVRLPTTNQLDTAFGIKLKEGIGQFSYTHDRPPVACTLAAAPMCRQFYLRPDGTGFSVFSLQASYCLRVHLGVSNEARSNCKHAFVTGEDLGDSSSQQQTREETRTDSRIVLSDLRPTEDYLGLGGRSRPEFCSPCVTLSLIYRASCCQTKLPREQQEGKRRWFNLVVGPTVLALPACEGHAFSTVRRDPVTPSNLPVKLLQIQLVKLKLGVSEASSSPLCMSGKVGRLKFPYNILMPVYRFHRERIGCGQIPETEGEREREKVCERERERESRGGGANPGKSGGPTTAVFLREPGFRRSDRKSGTCPSTRGGRRGARIIPTPGLSRDTSITPARRDYTGSLTATSVTYPTCDNPGQTMSGIEHGIRRAVVSDEWADNCAPRRFLRYRGARAVKEPAYTTSTVRHAECVRDITTGYNRLFTVKRNSSLSHMLAPESRDVTDKRHLATPLFDQRVVTNLSADSPANRQPSTARSSHSDIKYPLQEPRATNLTKKEPPRHLIFGHLIRWKEHLKSNPVIPIEPHMIECSGAGNVVFKALYLEMLTSRGAGSWRAAPLLYGRF
ncbi:hypothetical protein PR048_022158 [Dryococelus australis]|uniref:Uncharacterized protein n=1 Tax=Dryococelus australis TaxID=614101 RepID=A0ABQ9H0G6_9NEOP|nr:hypothetical protein PR048_022158 [Dryococelus australis]